jgi:hypothetical protein
MLLQSRSGGHLIRISRLFAEAMAWNPSVEESGCQAGSRRSLPTLLAHNIIGCGRDSWDGLKGTQNRVRWPSFQLTCGTGPKPCPWALRRYIHGRIWLSLCASPHGESLRRFRCKPVVCRSRRAVCMPCAARSPPRVSRGQSEWPLDRLGRRRCWRHFPPGAYRSVVRCTSNLLRNPSLLTSHHDRPSLTVILPAAYQQPQLGVLNR